MNRYDFIVRAFHFAKKFFPSSFSRENAMFPISKLERGMETRFVGRVIGEFRLLIRRKIKISLSALNLDDKLVSL